MVSNVTGEHPWLTERCKRLIRQKHQAESTLAYPSLRTQCSAAIVEAHSQYIARTKAKLERLPRDSKKWWKFSASLMDKSSMQIGVPALRDEHNEWKLDPVDKANHLEACFVGHVAWNN